MNWKHHLLWETLRHENSWSQTHNNGQHHKKTKESSVFFKCGYPSQSEVLTVPTASRLADVDHLIIFGHVACIEYPMMFGPRIRFPINKLCERNCAIAHGGSVPLFIFVFIYREPESERTSRRRDKISVVRSTCSVKLWSFASRWNQTTDFSVEQNLCATFQSFAWNSLESVGKFYFRCLTCRTQYEITFWLSNRKTIAIWLAYWDFHKYSIKCAALNASGWCKSGMQTARNDRYDGFSMANNSARNNNNRTASAKKKTWNSAL